MSASSRGMYWTAGRVVSFKVSARVVSAMTRPLKRTRTRFGLGTIAIGCSLGRSISVSLGQPAGHCAASPSDATKAGGLRSGRARLGGAFHRRVGEELGPALVHLVRRAPVDDPSLLHQDDGVESCQQMQAMDG